MCCTYRSPTDTWEKIDYSYLAKATRVNLITVANWVGAPPPPETPVAQLLTEGGSYRLQWQPDPLALRYGVAVRPALHIALPKLIFSEVGAIELTLDGLDPTITYAISIAPVGINGYLGGFSNEMLIP